LLFFDIFSQKAISFQGIAAVLIANKTLMENIGIWLENKSVPNRIGHHAEDTNIF